VRLTPRRHDRDVAGLTYVYPVVSRRAGGVSIGINLNPNAACNWRCVYCQVPGLTYGKGPPIDLELLRRELDGMLAQIFEGDYLEQHVPAEARRVNDVAFSGDGEPTSSPQFCEAVDAAIDLLCRRELLGKLEIVLITNGSLTHVAPVQAALERLGEHGGEVWFKLDSATEQGIARMNSAHMTPERVARNLRHAAQRCPTWVQTMVLARDGEPPTPDEVEAYLDFLRDRLEEGLPLRGVLLYGLARPSLQPEAPTLSPLPRAWMEGLAARLEKLGLTVKLSL